MKSLRIIIASCFLFFLFTNTYAQTKEETEKWITDKINKLMLEKNEDDWWTKPYYTQDLTKYIPVKFSIQDGKISIEYTRINTLIVTGDGETNKSVDEYSVTATAAINILDQVVNLSSPENNNGNHYTGYNYLIVILKCNCATFLSRSSKGTDTNMNTYVPLFMDFNAEPDIISRLNNAFTHLKTFYPAPKEIF